MALKTQVRLETLAKGKGPLTDRQLLQARRWIDDDWESHDIDRNAVKLINRLLLTVEKHKSLRQ